MSGAAGVNKVLVIALMIAAAVWQSCVPSVAQSPVPTSVGSNTPLARLEIALWPEYDQPEVLVILHGWVPEEQSLPAPIALRLPADVPALNAVAYLDPARNILISLQQFELTEDASGKLLRFDTPARQFQVEYYSRAMLERQDRTRTLTLSFSAPTDIVELVIEVQQPSGTQEFTSEPAPDDSQTRADGLTYAVYNFGPQTAGASLSLRASYLRSSEQLSRDMVRNAKSGGAQPGSGLSIPVPSQQEAVEAGGETLSGLLVPGLVALGALLIGVAVGYWAWSWRTSAMPFTHQAKRSQPLGASPVSANRRVRLRANRQLAAFCHRCGTRFRDDSAYCHTCGAKRRSD